MRLRFRLLRPEEANDRLWYLVAANRTQSNALRPAVLEYQDDELAPWQSVNCSYFPPTPQPPSYGSCPLPTDLAILIENDLKDIPK